MFSFLSKRIVALLFTALVIVPMFFLTPVTVTPEGVEVSITEAAGGWSCLYNTIGCVQFLFGGECGSLGWRCATRDLAELILVKIPMFFFGLAGIIFDTLLAFSLSSTIIKNADFVNKGWVIMRDLSNTFFIFILLYIAISTILQTAGGQTKRLLATLVMVALLMNFSLYITKFVIDVGNVFALEFYTNMGVLGQSYITLGTVGPNGIPSDIQPRSISAIFKDAFKLQALFGPDFLNQAPKNLPLTVFMFTLVGIMYLVAAFVFLSAGFLFLARVVAFWFLMILSPLAFFSMILPYTRGKIWGQWSSQLVSQSFFAPIFLFFVYLTIMLSATVNTLFVPDPNNPLVGELAFLQNVFISFLTFFALITTLLFGLRVAKGMSGAIGASMLSIGQKVTGAAVGAGLGATAVAYRQSIGHAANYWKDKYGKDMEKNKFGRAGLAVLNTAASGSGDVRALGGLNKVAGMGGLGLGAAGGKGGYEASVQQKRNEQSKKLDELLRTDPAGASKYLASLQDTASLDWRGQARGINPNSEVFAAMSKLSSEKRQELIANAKSGKEKDLLMDVNKSLGEGLTDKQKKQDALGEARYKNTEAKETIEEFESKKTEAERKEYLNRVVDGDPAHGVSGLSKEQRLALYKNMSGAQRAEAEAMSNQIFADINKETDLTKEELSKVLDQDKKYKDTTRENSAKIAQEARVKNIKTLMDEHATGRGRDLATLQREVAAHIRDMNENEVAALEATYLTSEVVAPHITSGVLAKVEKGYKIKLTVGQKEDFYKNLKDHNPKMKQYLEDRESAGTPRDAARRRFRGGRDNRNQGNG